MPLLVQTDGGEYVPSVKPKKDSYPRVLAAVAAGSALMLLGTARVAFRDGYDSFNAPADKQYPALSYSQDEASTSAVPADAARAAPRRAHPSSRLGQTDETAPEDPEPQDADRCASYQPRLATRAHVFGIGIDTENDNKNTEYMKEWLGRENCMSPEQVNEWLTISPGVNAYNWPEKFEDAEYAVRDLEKALAEQTEGALGLGNLYYAGAVAEARENGNTLPEGWSHIAHHVGCMYGHMYQWQRVWDEEWNDAVVLESDAPWSISIPAFAFVDIVRHQPSDYDIMFLTHGGAYSGEYMYSFDSHGPEYDSRLHVYRWNQMQGAAGLQGYVMQRRMKDKIEKFIVKSGGMDMVDAWLMIRVCSSLQDTGTYALNCYHVSPDPPQDRDVVLRDPDMASGDEGYVRVPRFELNSYPKEWPYDTAGEEAGPQPEGAATAAMGQAAAPAAAETEDAAEDPIEEIAAAADEPEAGVDAVIAATSEEEVSYEDSADSVAAKMEVRQIEAGEVAEAVGEMMAEAPEPAAEEVAPAPEEAAAAEEEAAAATEEAVPTTEGAVPTTEEAVPTTEEAVPATEEAVPAAEEAVATEEEAAAATEEAAAAATEPATASTESVEVMVDFGDVDDVLDIARADHDAYESSYGETVDAAEAPAGSERDDAEAMENEAPDAAAAQAQAEEALDEEITYDGEDAFAPAFAPEARR